MYKTPAVTEDQEKIDPGAPKETPEPQKDTGMPVWLICALWGLIIFLYLMWRGPHKAPSVDSRPPRHYTEEKSEATHVGPYGIGYHTTNDDVRFQMNMDKANRD